MACLLRSASQPGLFKDKETNAPKLTLQLRAACAEGVWAGTEAGGAEFASYFLTYLLEPLALLGFPSWSPTPALPCPAL